MQMRYIHPILGDYIANSSHIVSLMQQKLMFFGLKHNK
jgi:hypothetical protein